MTGTPRSLALACYLVAALTGGCLASESPPAPHPVRYTLSWKAERIERQDVGGWQLVNDLGYTVRLSRGYLISRSMELVECPRAAMPGSLATLLNLALTNLAPRSAHAGHSMGTPNPAAILTPHAESLAALGTSTAGSVTLQPQQYCSVHYLVARADPTTVGLPDNLDMVDTTLYVEGSFQPPGTAEKIPFQVKSPIANGAVLDLSSPGRFKDEAAKLRLDTGTHAAEVVIRRNADLLFTGVDFAVMPEQKVARQILKNLIDDVEIEVRPGS